MGGKGRDAWEDGKGGRDLGRGGEWRRRWKGGKGRDLGRGGMVREEEEGRDCGSEDPAAFMVLDRILSPPPPPHPTPGPSHKRL